jgi:hypothetical protein
MYDTRFASWRGQRRPGTTFRSHTSPIILWMGPLLGVGDATHWLMVLRSFLLFPGINELEPKKSRLSVESLDEIRPASSTLLFDPVSSGVMSVGASSIG